MTGLLVKGVGGLYTVYADGRYYFAKPRGKFRKDMLVPVIGDRVEFVPAQGGEDFGAIERIFPRKNCFVRPPVANIDLLLAVIAASSPQPDLMLTDKLLLHAAISAVETVLVVNKTDLGLPQDIVRQYALSNYQVYPVCASDGQGIGALHSRMQGKVSAYAGQSAVGKSSILNALCDGFNIKTGGLSRIQRGRHTTRHVELLPLGDDSWVCDTPGFSLLDLDAFDPQELKGYYHEFEPYSANCRFLGCNHIGEPGCAVKQAVQAGGLSAQRHERYIQIYNELKEKWSRRYD